MQTNNDNNNNNNILIMITILTIIMVYGLFTIASNNNLSRCNHLRTTPSGSPMIQGDINSS
jgi:hypothetical protein